jgi:hypothetical protein
VLERDPCTSNLDSLKCSFPNNCIDYELFKGNQITVERGLVRTANVGRSAAFTPTTALSARFHADCPPPDFHEEMSSVFASLVPSSKSQSSSRATAAEFWLDPEERDVSPFKLSELSHPSRKPPSIIHPSIPTIVSTVRYYPVRTIR